MTIPFLIIAGYLCATPIKGNITPFEWNANDEWVYQTAVRRCVEKFERSPCLKTFNKIGEQDYKAICGGALK